MKVIENKSEVSMKKYSGIIVIYIISLIPIILWAQTEINFQKFGLSVYQLGQMFGLVGGTLLSINFILSSRLKLLENLFGSLNKVYIIHHLVGAYAFILITFHPILIGLSYLKYSKEAVYLALIPTGENPYTLSGIIAYFILALLIVLTLYVKIPYHIWKLTHKFMGLPLVFTLLHISGIPSTVTYNFPLRYYMLFIMTLGLLSYVRRTLLGRLFIKNLKYKVVNVKKLKNVTEMTLEPLGKKLVYNPGQSIFIRFDSKKVGREEHPFSLTSTPTDDFISIALKMSGDYTNTLPNLETNATAIIEGPFGEFSYKLKSPGKQIWIAGGIGIAPFLSMAKSFTANNGYQITLYYITKNESEAVYLKPLQGFDHKLSNFNIVPVFTEKEGRITARAINSKQKDLKKNYIFLCGPPTMMKDLRRQFNELGMKNSRIFSEEFSLN